MDAFKPLYFAWALALIVVLMISQDDSTVFQGITEVRDVVVKTKNPAPPSIVKGIIHESISNRVKVGEQVSVNTIKGRGNGVTGEVVGMGTRIVAYPERLLKSPGTRSWGRIVEVRLPENNRFLQGERVKIRSFDKPGPSLLARLKALLSMGKSYAGVNRERVPQADSGASYHAAPQNLANNNGNNIETSGFASLPPLPGSA